MIARSKHIVRLYYLSYRLPVSNTFQRCIDSIVSLPALTTTTITTPSNITVYNSVSENSSPRGRGSKLQWLRSECRVERRWYIRRGRRRRPIGQYTHTPAQTRSSSRSSVAGFRHSDGASPPGQRHSRSQSASPVVDRYRHRPPRPTLRVS